MPISCHLRDCKALLVTSLTHVSGAIASDDDDNDDDDDDDDDDNVSVNHWLSYL